MIAKNEENNIGEAIKSVIGIADEIIVIDTGSSDKTVEVASKFPKVKIGHFPWIDDFSAARNVSIRNATMEWVLFIDADDAIDNPNEILETIRSGKNLVYDCTIQSGFDEWQTTRLFKNNCNSHFYGMIHECLSFKYPKGSCGVRITHHVGKPHSEDRVTRNLRILRKEDAGNPGDPRTLFYLGQTLRSAGQYDESVGVYSRYIYLSSFNEEKYIAQKEIGKMYMSQKMYRPAIDEFMKCIEIDDRWREHSYYIGECYYYLGEYNSCISHMEHAINKPEPTTIMWKEKKLYLDAPYRYLFACHALLEEYEDALKYCLIVKNMLPDDQWVSDRYEYFKGKIGTISSSKVIECFRWGALGDVIMTTAALRGLKEKFPDHKIRYITHPGNNDLLAGNKYIDEIDGVSHGDTNHKYSFSYPKDYPGKPLDRHLVKIFNECAGLPDNTIDLECTLSEDDDRFGVELKERHGEYVTVHVQSGWSQYKDWRIERWNDIAEFIYDNGLAVVQIGGSENPILRNGSDYRGAPIKYSISAIKHSKFHVGVDSFSNHASWAVKKRSLILFGSTSPVGSGYDQNVNVYLGMECGPCYKENPSVSKDHRGPCPIQGKCMTDISVDTIKSILQERFLT
jgi:ADP-heptose:LPS heptosyltransferase